MKQRECSNWFKMGERDAPGAAGASGCRRGEAIDCTRFGKREAR